MPDQTSLGIPFPLPADALVDYPALGADLAAVLDELLGAGSRDLHAGSITLEAGVIVDNAEIGATLQFGADATIWLRRNGGPNGNRIEGDGNLDARALSAQRVQIGSILGGAPGIAFGAGDNGTSIYNDGPSHLVLWDGDAAAFVTLYGLFASPARLFEEVASLPADCLLDPVEPPLPAGDDDEMRVAPAEQAVDLVKLCDYLVAKVGELEQRVATLEAAAG